MLVKKPLRALELAVSGMLPKNKLRKDMISRLK
jgi:large subunit ribosomal protein L13